MTDPGLEARVRPLLLHCCQAYLLEAKRKAQVLDPVANFHLSNGARIWRLNWR
jgi:malonyl-CoA decarboxylase